MLFKFYDKLRDMLLNGFFLRYSFYMNGLKYTRENINGTVYMYNEYKTFITN